MTSKMTPRPETPRLALGAIMIFAKDLRRLRDFYCDVLGFTLLPGQSDPDEFLELEPGDPAVGRTSPARGQTSPSRGRIVLHRIPDAIAHDIEITDPPGPRSDTALKFILHTAEPEAVHQGLETLGVQVGPLHKWAKARYFDVVDPEGNVFQVSNG